MDRPRLRDLHHPDLSELLVHFTGRPRPRTDLPDAIRQLDARGRLEGILQERAIWAMTTFYAPVPTVCFTESTRPGLEYMIGEAGFEPWGIVFHRETVFDQGGGPVFHLRDDEWEYRDRLPDRLRSRIIRFAPGEAEWVEEREWRVPYDSGEPGFVFTPDQVVALIVGDPRWPPPVEKMDMVFELGDWGPGIVPSPPDWLPDCERWIWQPERQRLGIVG
ncbi:MAG: hypothetical protein WD895_05195 [Acidimicrobiia bacterium]